MQKCNSYIEKLNDNVTFFLKILRPSRRGKNVFRSWWEILISIPARQPGEKLNSLRTIIILQRIFFWIFLHLKLLAEEIFLSCLKKLPKGVSVGMKFNYKTDIWYFLSITQNICYCYHPLPPLLSYPLPDISDQPTFFFRMTAWVSVKELFGFYHQRSQDSR